MQGAVFQTWISRENRPSDTSFSDCHYPKFRAKSRSDRQLSRSDRNYNQSTKSQGSREFFRENEICAEEIIDQNNNAESG